MSWSERASLHLFAAQRQTAFGQARISWPSYGVFSGWKPKGGSWSLMPCTRLSITSLTRLKWKPGWVNRSFTWWMKRKGRCVSESLKAKFLKTPLHLLYTEYFPHLIKLMCYGCKIYLGRTLYVYLNKRHPCLLSHFLTRTSQAHCSCWRNIWSLSRPSRTMPRPSACCHSSAGSCWRWDIQTGEHTTHTWLFHSSLWKD